MSEEYTSYIEKMKSTYNEIFENIKIDYDAKKYDHPLQYLTKNNDKIQNYLIHFRIGTGLSDDNENLKALQKLNEVHDSFMKQFYQLIGWEPLR